MQPKYTWSRKDVGYPKSTSLLSTFHIGSMFCFFPANFMSSTCTDQNNPFSRCTNKHFQLETFSQLYFKRISQIAFPLTVLPKDDRTVFVQEERLGLRYWTTDFGHWCRARRIQTSGHCDLEILRKLGASSIFTWVYADTASAACPSQPGNLEMISMILAAVIWDAEDPCSVNTA